MTAPPPANTTTDGVHFSVETVSAGVHRLALDNGVSHQIGYNLCMSELHRRDGSGWAKVETDLVCTMQLLTLNPGADATFEMRPGSLPAGEYRYVTRVESPLGTAGMLIATNTFVVR